MRITKHFKSVICLALTMLMLFSVVLGVSAAEEDVAQIAASGTVYFENNSGWSSVYCYMWNGGGEQKNAEWPGQPMNNVKGNVWSYSTTTDYQNVIFNNGSGGNGNQTADLQFPGDGQIFNGSSWSQYSDPTPTTPTKPNPNPTTPTTPTPNPSGGKYVYCENAAGWGTVYCYMWKNGSGDNATWPGVTMTNIGENIWQYEVSGDFDMIIFNGGSDSQKTGDMQFPGGDYIYNNSTSEWKPYDTSPITVKSYGTDVESPQYKGMDISLSASAVSTGGIVYYKFSVTNASGATTVLRDFSSATTATWTPTVAGTYTLTYEFKDGAGNTNKRTATFTVNDDSGVSEPIIKKVSPAPGQVKYNTNMNIAVTAAGGKVGTNLIFYKYTVKDANGKIINVPYYTKNASYTYKPTTQGKFTVTVSLQNSSNDVVERTFTYDSVMNITPTTPTPTETMPTTPTPGPTGVLGDVDGDSVVSVMDATQIQRFIAQLVTSSELNLAVGDFDKDGKVSIMDATAIQQFLAGLN